MPDETNTNEMPAAPIPGTELTAEQKAEIAQRAKDRMAAARAEAAAREVELAAEEEAKKVQAAAAGAAPVEFAAPPPEILNEGVRVTPFDMAATDEPLSHEQLVAMGFASADNPPSEGRPLIGVFTPPGHEQKHKDIPEFGVVVPEVGPGPQGVGIVLGGPVPAEPVASPTMPSGPLAGGAIGDAAPVENPPLSSIQERNIQEMEYGRQLVERAAAGVRARRSLAGEAAAKRLATRAPADNDDMAVPKGAGE